MNECTHGIGKLTFALKLWLKVKNRGIGFSVCTIYVNVSYLCSRVVEHESWKEKEQVTKQSNVRAQSAHP